MIPVPTRRLAAIAALASLLVLAAPVSPLAALLVVDGLLIVVAIVDAVLAPSPATVSVERETPGVVPLGRQAPMRWRVGNPTDRPLRARLADELAPSLRAGSRRAAVTSSYGRPAVALPDAHRDGTTAERRTAGVLACT